MLDRHPFLWYYNDVLKKHCSLAQSVERMTVNHDVVSSSLTGAAIRTRLAKAERVFFLSGLIELPIKKRSEESFPLSERFLFYYREKIIDSRDK